MATYSRVRASGLGYGWPYQPSTTCGPEAPRPSTKPTPASGYPRPVGQRVEQGSRRRRVVDGDHHRPAAGALHEQALAAADDDPDPACPPHAVAPAAEVAERVHLHHLRADDLVERDA